MQNGKNAVQRFALAAGLLAVSAGSVMAQATPDPLITAEAENLEATFLAVFAIMIVVTVAMIGRKFLRRVG